MAWVVDTSVVLDLHTGDPVFEPVSTACLLKYLADGLVICPISFSELGPSFSGDAEAAASFLQQVGISANEDWTNADTIAAHLIWHNYTVRKRQGLTPRRPLADVLIAAFARRYQGIITRNSADFHAIDPSLNVVEP